MAAVPMKIERQKDGRHAVVGPDGSIHGMHNSVWSAARQMHDYFGSSPGSLPSGTPPTGNSPTPPVNTEPVGQARAQRGTEAVMQKPSIPRPSSDVKPTKKPSIPKPKK